jgi:predicted DNA-binding mobile mystery protein A
MTVDYWPLKMTASRRDGTMREEQREMARRELDKKLRYYRQAGREKYPTRQLLRKVRQALGVPMAEVARKAGMNRSVIFRLEESEARSTISLRSMTRIANALDCEVVYAVIPRDGTTLEEMAARRKWGKYVGVRE